jgi:hypothetical protein
MSRRLFFTSATLLMTFMLAGHAHAGQKKFVPVSFQHEPAPNLAQFSGSIGDARASADTLQSIGCAVGGGDWLAGQCYATDAAGDGRMCTFDAKAHPTLVQVLSTLTPYSVITVEYTTDTFNCNRITVDNASYYLPITP